MVRHDPTLVYKEIVDTLADYGIPDVEFDVRCIIEQVTGQKLMLMRRDLTEEEYHRVHLLTERRILREPLQYILGEWEFFGMRMFVGEGVLIPRPDTEVLVETVLEWCRDLPHPRIIDLCTGSGCIALALQKHLPGAEVHALDISDAALAYAQRNIDYHRLPVILHKRDVLCETVPGRFDVIVSNPPYLTNDEMAHLQPEIRYEPALALAAGQNGQIYYDRIATLWKDALNPGGLLAFEIGEQQGKTVSGYLKWHGYQNIRVIRDYAHHDRVVTANVP